MQFQVPQFIEVEDKIFGPLTFKQFIYLAGAAGLGYILWRVLPAYLAAPLIAAIFGLGAALAFFKYNGQPFIVALEHAFFYLMRGKLYLWSNELQKNERGAVRVEKNMSASQVYVPKLSESKLHELAWSLDIKERIAGGVANEEDRANAELPDRVSPLRTAREALVR